MPKSPLFSTPSNSKTTSLTMTKLQRPQVGRRLVACPNGLKLLKFDERIGQAAGAAVRAGKVEARQVE